MNKRFVKNFLMFVMGVGLLVFLYPVYLWTNQAQFSANLQLAALLSGSNVAVVLDPQTKTFGCQVQGPLPDHGCTPGAVFKNTTKDQICVTGYTKTVRSVSTSLRKKVFAEYGIDYDQPFGSYEADHLIPLALGGNNDISNLFPEAASPYPGFKEKDVVENYLHEQVCAGNVALSVAQEKIANDWLAIYNSLDAKTIQDLKNKYRSWAPDNPELQ